MDTRRRARIAEAVAGRDLSDYARGLVGVVADPQPPGARIRAWRRARVLALTGLDRAVLVERADGATWTQIGDALGLPAGEARARYERVYDQWAAGELDPDPAPVVYGPVTVGMVADPDPEGTAAAVDAWCARTADPWDAPVDRPVSRVLD